MNVHELEELLQLNPGCWAIDEATDKIRCICCDCVFSSLPKARTHADGTPHALSVERYVFATTHPQFELGGKKIICRRCRKTFSNVEGAMLHFCTDLEKLLAFDSKINPSRVHWKDNGDGSFLCTTCNVKCLRFEEAVKHQKSFDHKHSVSKGARQATLRTVPAGATSAVDVAKLFEIAVDDVHYPPQKPKKSEFHAPKLGADLETQVKAFWDGSPLSLPEDELPTPVSVEEKTTLLKGFQKKFDVDATSSICGVCGCLFLHVGAPEHLSWDGVQALRADEEMKARYVKVPEKYKKAFNLAFDERGDAFHLDPLTLSSDGFTSCQDCWTSLRADKVPKFCFKSGFDMGHASRIGLPALTIFEKAMIARVRHYHTIVKFKGFSLDAEKISGHYISFPHEGVRVVTTLPRTDIADSFAIVFVGSNKQFEDHRHVFKEQALVRKGVMIAWLEYLCACVGSYADVQIDQQGSYDDVIDKMLDGAQIADSRLAAALEKFTGHSKTEEAASFEHVLVTPQVADVENLDVMRSVMNAARKVVPRTTDDVLRQRDQAAMQISREARPVNEFEENSFLFGSGFPWLFEHFNFSLISKKGTLPTDFVKHLCSYGDGRFSRDSVFAFVVINQLQRHTLSRQIASRVKVDHKTSHQDFLTLWSKPEFSARLDAAIGNPDLKESKSLQRHIMRHIETFSSKVPWSPGERKACLGHIYAMYHYGGLPTWYYTISPADMDQPHMLSMAFRSMSEPDKVIFKLPFPDVSERIQLQKANPCYAAMVFDKLITSIIEELLRIASVGKKEKKGNSFGRGVFSRCFLNFSVVEAQGRGSLHLHGLAWTDLTPRMLSSVAGTDKEGEIAKTVDSMVRTEMDYRFSKPESKFRGALQKCPFPDDSDFPRYVNDICDCVQRHETHAPGCWSHGNICRFAMPSPLCESTGAYELKEVSVVGSALKTEVNACPPEEILERCLDDLYGYEMPDRRPILWITKRADNKDARVVGYNDVLSAASGSNIAIVILGAVSQAVAVMYYLIKYLTKNSVPLANSLVCMKEALAIKKKYEEKDATSTNSNWREGKSEACIQTRHLLNKLGNRMLAKTEISAQQAFAAIMGQPSSYTSHCFSFCRVWESIKLRKMSAREINDVAAEKAMAAEDASTDDNESDKTSEDSEVSSESASDMASESEGSDSDVNVPIDVEGAGFSSTAKSLVVRQQQVDYSFRGPELGGLSLYEYAAMISVIAVGVEDKDKQIRRPKCLRFRFDAAHPLAGTHQQQLRYKLVLPILCGRPCPRLVTNSRSDLRVHSTYMCTLFVPWSYATAKLEDPVALWRSWLETMRNGARQDKARYLCAQNVMRPLSARGPFHELINKYRFKCADGKSDPTEKEKPSHDADDELENALREIDKAMCQPEDDEPFVLEMVDALDALHRSIADIPQPENISTEKPAIKVHTASVEGSVKHRIVPKVSPAPTSTLTYDTINPFCPETLTGIPQPPSRFDDELYSQQRSAFVVLINAVYLEQGQRLFVLHGGPGTGKSVVARELIILCPQLIATATTGIAARLLHASAKTYQTALQTMKKNIGGPELLALRDVHKGKRFVLVDEMSMLGVEGLSDIDEACRKLKGNEREAFGGMGVILVGDFFQLQAVCQRILFKDDRALRDFKVIQLTTDIRTKGDSIKRQIVADVRITEKCGEALRLFVRTVKYLSKDDHEFVDAPILVATNFERCAVNRQCASAFSCRTGFPLIEFELPENSSFTGTRKQIEGLFYFVKTAPGLVIENDPSGLCNGMHCRLHSLSYKDNCDLRKAQNALKDFKPGVPTRVPRPSTVNILFEGHVYPLPLCGHVSRKDPYVEFRAVPGFACTYHKAQGFTFEKAILQINDRPPKRGLGRLPFSALYVGASRTGTMAGMRVFPPSGTGFSHVLALRPDPKLIAWLRMKAGMAPIPMEPKTGRRAREKSIRRKSAIEGGVPVPKQKATNVNQQKRCRSPVASMQAAGSNLLLTMPAPTTAPPQAPKRTRSPENLCIGILPAIVTLPVIVTVPAIRTLPAIGAEARSGIVNTGNSCYQSAVMQSMLSFGEVLSALIEMRLAFPPEVFAFLESILAGNGSIAADPSDLLRLFPPQFKNRTQNDAGEFFDVIMGDVLYGTPLDTLFRFEELTKVTCGTCGNLTTTSDTGITVKVSIVKGKDMQWIINARHSKQNLAGDNGYACIKCAALSGFDIKSREALRDAEQQVCVRHAPSILVVVVQRFLFYGSKLRDTVMNTDAVEYGGRRYRLRAEIRHIGDTQSAGHYTSVSMEGNRMVEYDDRTVKTVLPGAVPIGDVYVLWYAQDV